MKGNNYYPNPSFFNSENVVKEENLLTIDNNLISILNANKGKMIKCFWLEADEHGKNIEGIVEFCGPDYLIISNHNNGEWSIILINYIKYLTFKESIKLP